MADVNDGSVPRVIGGRYETARLIGRGGMGSVWLAKDTLLGRQVAIKQIGDFPGETERETERALREARSAAALNHPNVVALYDAIKDEGGAPWLVMEYVAGPTLAAWVREHGPMEPETGAEVGARLASGLAAAHRAGIVHRDIKPANVFMADDGEPKIGDFGTARGLVDDHLTIAGVVTGTPSFMAPEVADGGEHGEAADVWALGATLYFAVEGEDAYPGAGNALATLRTIATQPPRSPQRAGALEPVLAQMLAHDPSRRGTMHDVMRRLEAVAPGRPGAISLVGAGAVTTAVTEDEETNGHFVSQETDEAAGLFGFPDAPEPRPRGAKSRRGVLLAGIVAAVLVGGVGVAALTLGDEDREANPTTSTSRSTSSSSTESTTPSTSRATSSSTSMPTSEPVAPPPEPTTEVAPEPTTEEPLPEPTSEPVAPPPETTTQEPPAPTTEEPAPETTSESPSPEPTPTSTPTSESPTSESSEPTETSEPTQESSDTPTETSEPTGEFTQSTSGSQSSSVGTPSGGAE